MTQKFRHTPICVNCQCAHDDPVVDAASPTDRLDDANYGVVNDNPVIPFDYVIGSDPCEGHDLVEYARRQSNRTSR